MQTFNANDSGEAIRLKLNQNSAEADTEDAANIKKDGSVAFTADQSMGGNQITNVGEPGSAQDAATKSYVDALSVALTTAIADAIAAAKQALYPVGSIYYNASVSTNPGTLLGFGTWAVHGAGRVSVGIDATQTEFDTIGETGGEKTHLLLSAESGVAVHPHGVTDPGHRHTQAQKGVQSGSGETVADNDTTDEWTTATAVTGLTVNNAAGADAAQAHNNLQPYVVVYAWKRTA